MKKRITIFARVLLTGTAPDDAVLESDIIEFRVH